MPVACRSGSRTISIRSKHWSAYFDWALNEQCFQYNECNLLTPFITAGKAVFVVEYSLATTAFCPQAVELKFNAMKKNLDLDAPRTAVPVTRHHAGRRPRRRPTSESSADRRLGAGISAGVTHQPASSSWKLPADR